MPVRKERANYKRITLSLTPPAIERLVQLEQATGQNRSLIVDSLIQRGSESWLESVKESIEKGIKCGTK